MSAPAERWPLGISHTIAPGTSIILSRARSWRSRLQPGPQSRRTELGGVKSLAFLSREVVAATLSIAESANHTAIPDVGTAHLDLIGAVAQRPSYRIDDGILPLSLMPTLDDYPSSTNRHLERQRQDLMHSVPLTRGTTLDLLAQFHDVDLYPEVEPTPLAQPPVRRWAQRRLRLTIPSHHVSGLSQTNTRFLEPEHCHCDSPIQDTTDLAARSDAVGTQHLDDIVGSVLEFESSFSGLGQSSPVGRYTSPSANAEREITRKMLIIGSHYTRGVRRTYTISSTITLESPTSDKNRLRESFEQRGYSVHSLINDVFDREQALDTIAEFIATGHCGDVRAIVFTGHADDDRVVPPVCPSRQLAISAEEWERTIRDNAQPGVIVLSIFATCFSGHFMKQPIDLRDTSSAIASNVPLTMLGEGNPVLVTFSSAARDERSYESSIERRAPFRVADHFLYALDQTARSPNVRSWSGFIQTMQEHFERARDIGASYAAEQGYAISPADWKFDNPQTTSFNACTVPTLARQMFRSIFPDRPG
ncbi:ICE-like protease (caspase) p20 domain protein [Ceratobasidium sp. AG-Ba]|nr:ICE-like protease (caspase) p20 domain protein [Ceratobasidium sp. AG-Ba]QRW01145.1 ICE-like protease (caspase) p20 domain protein [Ceratobasidium sp. AG-Ba]